MSRLKRFDRVVTLLALIVSVSACNSFGGRNSDIREKPKPSNYHIALLVYANPDPATVSTLPCVTTTVPPHLSVQHDDSVTWDIIDTCPIKQDIDVRDFTPLFDASHTKHVKKDSGASNGKIRLVFKVEARPDLDIYKYSVYRGATRVEDPELQIDR